MCDAKVSTSNAAARPGVHCQHLVSIMCLHWDHMLAAEIIHSQFHPQPNMLTLPQAFPPGCCHCTGSPRSVPTFHTLHPTGGGAALWAAAYLGTRISAVVVRGGRPDLASAKLPAVTAPTLLLVGSEDTHVLELNNEALQEMGSSDSSQVVVVPGAGHLFEGPRQLEHVAELAVEWFRAHMGPQGDE